MRVPGRRRSLIDSSKINRLSRNNRPPRPNHQATLISIHHTLLLGLSEAVPPRVGQPSCSKAAGGTLARFVCRPPSMHHHVTRRDPLATHCWTATVRMVWRTSNWLVRRVLPQRRERHAGLPIGSAIAGFGQFWAPRVADFTPVHRARPIFPVRTPPRSAREHAHDGPFFKVTEPLPR